MMSRELISYDPFSGISQFHDYDPYTDTSRFVSVGDATPALELNRARANDADGWKQGVRNDFALYASIPTIFQVKLMAERGIDVYKKDHGHRLSKVLEDPDYRHLKCTSKKHIIKSYD